MATYGKAATDFDCITKPLNSKEGCLMVEGLTRRRVLGSFAAVGSLSVIGEAAARARLYRGQEAKEYPLFDQAMADVFPSSGYQSRVALKDSVIRLVSEGVISLDKVKQLEEYNGKSPADLAGVLTRPSGDPIRLTRENASGYVNFLWPAGLANRLRSNNESPLVGPDLPTFASTGGWNLGKAENGGVYFNKFSIIDLKPEAEAVAVEVAKTTYRPCCNNSTFFQDCNHGSALYAVLQLGASEGLSISQLYREALAFNSFWFPEYYIATALYFKVIRKMEWGEVDPKSVMAADFSAGGPWQKNVSTGLSAIPDLIPPPQGGANCGT